MAVGAQDVLGPWHVEAGDELQAACFLSKVIEGSGIFVLFCRQARCGIGLSLPCFFMPLFSFLFYLFRYSSCQYIIVLEISDYNMHLVLIVTCLIFFLSICKFSSNTFLITMFVRNPVFLVLAEIKNYNGAYENSVELLFRS